jgi:serine-type D-Ala-D-Ala carboxypeptidase (penicillin-binding protein 5/6)
MEEFPGKEEPQDAAGRATLSEEERRALLEKRIKELRKSKQREKRRSGRRIPRVLISLILVAFFLLCLSSSLLAIGRAGGNQGYISFEMPASNLDQLESLDAGSPSIAEPSLAASAAFLLDPQTDDVLYEMNADQALPMASTTKVMTAILVLENANLSDSVTISEHASTVGESSAWLEKGEVLTVEQLLYALLIQSANDAAVALAEHVGGSEEAFVGMMNEKAQELGLENTHFANPHGLDAEGHYTSARDLAITAAYAMRIPLFREIVVSTGYEIPWPGNPYPRVLENHNKLLDMYPYATGIKTGYTLGAGKCLVASASKNGRELISVVLNGGDSYWDQTIQLMDYGFNDFSRVEYSYSDQPLAVVEVGDFPRREVNAVPSNDLVFTVRLDYLDDFETARIYYREWLPYPVEEGREVGYMEVGEGTPQEIVEPLVSDAGQKKPGIITRFLALIGSVLGLWWAGIKWLIPGI